MITEVPTVPLPQTVEEAPAVVVDDNAGIPEETSEIASQEANKGGDTRSSLNNSVHSSDNIPSDSMNASGSDAPDSSRGSTKVSGTVIEEILYPEDEEWMASYNYNGRNDPYEPETNEDGSKKLTKKYLRDLFASNFRKYYRTPYLNEKLYLHYKGFSKMDNMA